jgi:hypothetical protein
MLLLATLCVGRAGADPFARHATPFRNASAGTIVVPAAWAGVWVNCDSTYDCTGAFKSASCDTDTLCTGQVFDTDTLVTCTGSFTSSTFTEQCSGTLEVFTDCQVNYNVEGHGTRTADTFFSVFNSSTSYSGIGAGCDLFPPSCSQINSHGTRISAAPPAYCATPARLESWGKLKATYR